MGRERTGGAAYLASLAVARAQNRAQFLSALARWKMPCLNFVYADVDGEIGWVAAAATPVRRAGNGLLPVLGDTDRYEWERFLRVDELPQTFNPPRGWLATANQNILPTGYPHQIAYDWSGPYRYRRIEERLREKASWTLEDFQSIQHDSTSLAARMLVSAIREVPFPTELRRWAELLTKWDGNLDLSSKAGPLYAAWMQELTAAMYALHGGLEETTDRGELRSTPVILHHLANPAEAWFGPDPKARRDKLLAETLAKAADRIQKLLGNDFEAWSWGKLHQATFHHPFESLSPAYAKAFNLGPVPRAGDGNTPLNTRYDKDFQQIHGATYRHVLDLADWDRGMATSAPGQSGQPGSPHYGDLLPLWADAKYFPLAFSRNKVEELTTHRLRLVPGAQP